MGRVSTCQKNCNTIDLRRAQVNDCLLTHREVLLKKKKKKKPFTLTFRVCINTPSGSSSRECCIPTQDCFKGPRLAAVAEPQAPQVGTIEHRSSDRAGAISEAIGDVEQTTAVPSAKLRARALPSATTQGAQKTLMFNQTSLNCQQRKR